VRQPRFEKTRQKEEIMKPTIRVLLPLLAGLSLFVAACDAGGSSVRVGVEASNPPLEYRGEGDELVGFDISLMEAVAQEGGFEIEWVDLTWGEFVDALTEGQVDVTLAGATLPVQVGEGITVGTQVISDVVQSVDFSDPFFVAEERFYRTSWSGDVERIGYQSGWLVLTSDEELPDSLVFEEYPTLEDAFGALQDGTVDAIHASKHRVEYHLPEGSEEVPSIGAQYVDYSMSIRQGTGLSETLNVALQSLIDNGTYAALYTEWFDDEVPYAYRSLEERDDAVLEQAQTILDMGRAHAGGIVECMATSEWSACLHDIGEATLEHAGAMEVEPPLQALHDALLELGRACLDVSLSNIGQLTVAISDYQSIAGRVTATFVR
jgi:glutamine transport system substrate-binding protein